MQFCILIIEHISINLSLFCLKNLQEAKEAKSRKKARSKSALTLADPLSPTSKGVQLNITQFYRSSKGEPSESSKDRNSSVEKRNARSGNFSKSARRRLLFG